MLYAHFVLEKHLLLLHGACILHVNYGVCNTWLAAVLHETVAACNTRTHCQHP